MNWLDKLERKFGRYAIPNLMYYIIILYGAGFVLNMVNSSFYYQYLALDIGEVLHGQIWRLLTFIIQPPSDSLIFIVFAMYLYYMIGIQLERAWGTFRFNVYFFSGMFFHIFAAFIIYFAMGLSLPMSSWYLNMSLFFAFATVYPDMELYLFFILPIKIKWLALIDGAYFILTIFSGFSWYLLSEDAARSIARVALKLGIVPLPEIATAALVSLLNFVVFFLITRNYKRYSPGEIRRKQRYRTQVRQSRGNAALHKCDICGRTSESNPELSFRYCSKCVGNHEYCEDHLFTHQHIQ